ncbi:MAG: lipoprotein [Pseudomonadota bacterium]
MEQIRQITNWLVIMGFSLWVASCGQKGPLYLPESYHYSPQSHLINSPASKRSAVTHLAAFFAAKNVSQDKSLS